MRVDQKIPLIILGIPLVSSVSIALYNDHQIDMPYSFNRKEKKLHGEGGNIVGSALKGNIMIVDDVITAGTAIRESMELIKQNGAQLAGVLILLDRCEISGENSQLSSIQQIKKDYNVDAVISVVTLSDIIEYLEQTEADSSLKQHLPKIMEYRQKYGVE